MKSIKMKFLIYLHYPLQNALANEDVELIANSLEKKDIETPGTSKELREKDCYDIQNYLIRLLRTI